MSRNKKYNPSEYADRLDCGDRALNRIYDEAYEQGVAGGIEAGRGDGIEKGIKMACEIIVASAVGTKATRERLVEEILTKSAHNAGKDNE